MWKQIVFWLLLPLLIVVFVTLGAHSIYVRVPTEEHKNCLQAAKETGDKYPYCPSDESVWERGLSDPVAYYTLWLTLFTGALAVVGIGQGILLGQQMKLDREEFISSHRPKLRLRHLRIELPIVGLPVKLRFTLSNIGDTPANVAIVDVTLILQSAIEVRDKKGQLTGYEDARMVVNFPTGATIAAGDSVVLSGESATHFDPIWKAPTENWLIARTQVVGTVTYADARGVRRQTAFYRECQGLNRFDFMRFTKAQKRDWEYED
jgi:hypothetical protein